MIAHDADDGYGWIDEHLQGSYMPDVLNGIAFDEENDRLFLTGKQWSKMFEVKVVPMDPDSARAHAENVRRKCIPDPFPL